MTGRRQRQTFGGFLRRLVVDLGLRLVFVVILLAVVLPLAIKLGRQLPLPRHDAGRTRSRRPRLDAMTAR